MLVDYVVTNKTNKKLIQENTEKPPVQKRLFLY